METLNFSPDYQASKKQSPKLSEVDFGDGYTQSRPQGLNHNRATFNLTFSGNPARIRQIDDFLTRHGGYQAFLWTPPFGIRPLGSRLRALKCRGRERAIDPRSRSSILMAL